MNNPIRKPQTLLTATVGITMLLFGASQTMRPQRWVGYLPASVAKLLPMSPETALQVHGSTNILLGAWLLVRPNRLSASTSSVWWLAVSSACARKEGWHTGLRDIAIAAALLSAAASADKQ